MEGGGEGVEVVLEVEVGAIDGGCKHVADGCGSDESALGLIKSDSSVGFFTAGLSSGETFQAEFPEKVSRFPNPWKSTAASF